VSPEGITSQSPRQRAYNLSFQKKLGEVVDLTGRALAAAGLGAGVVAELAADRVPRPGFLPMVIAVIGVALIYGGISWQCAADADRDCPNA
jgi:hypothetical protein